jgi:hypothetical protein
MSTNAHKFMKLYYKRSNNSYMFRPVMLPSSGRCITKNNLRLLVSITISNWSVQESGSFKIKKRLVYVFALQQRTPFITCPLSLPLLPFCLYSLQHSLYFFILSFSPISRINTLCFGRLKFFWKTLRHLSQFF